MRVQTVTQRHRVTQILVTFSGGVNAGEADNLATYRLAIAGKKGSFTAKNAKVIPLKSAVYNSATKTVLLTLAKPLVLNKPVQVLIHGEPPSGLQDSAGRLIDGNHDGQPGGDAIALLNRGGVSLNALVGHPPTDFRPRVAAAIDALLAQHELIGWLDPPPGSVSSSRKATR
jgi:hypothetical protein